MSAFQFVLFLILCPAFLALVVIIIPGRLGGLKSLIAFFAAGFNLFMAIRLFSQLKAGGEGISQLWPWAGMGIDFSILVDYFNSFIIFAAAFFAFLIIFYTIAYIRRRDNSGLIYFYMLLSLSLTNGAVMANNLVMLLFFWVGLLIVIFGMILQSGLDKYPTAVKSLVIGGGGDLLLMLGLAITALLGGTLTINGINPIPIEGIGVLGFICLILGAIAKAGAIPFSLWLPKAGEEATLPFMAFLPGGLSMLLGIYLLSRIILNFYIIEAFSRYSHFVMLFGVLTILIPLLLAFKHKDLKGIITYIAISQAGYMVLGIGTALPMGITGGIFHMLNSTIFIICLFLAAGAVQRQVGSTDLNNLAGVGKYMPITTLCFLVGSAAAVGVPFSNGFFSRELILAAVFEEGLFYYLVALFGAFLSGILLIKLLYRAFFSKPLQDFRRIREAPGAMLLPMLILALACIIFGVYNPLPLRGMIQPALGDALGEMDFSGLPQSYGFGIITFIVLMISVFGYLYGVKKGWGLQKLLSYIFNSPGVKTVYNKLNKEFFGFNKTKVIFNKGYAQAKAAVLKVFFRLKKAFANKIPSKSMLIIAKLKQSKFSKYLSWAVMGLGIVICVFLVTYLNL